MENDAGAQVLVVDDDENTRAAICDLLRGQGYRVATAANGGEALAYLHAQAGGGNLPRLIILDLMLPRMNGWVFRIEQLRDSALRRIPVIILSGAVEPEPPAQFLHAEAAFRKPIEVSELLREVSRLCSRGDP